jgi:hypothetical protein
MVHASAASQYVDLTSALRTWVAVVHAVLSHRFRGSQHVVWSFSTVQLPSLQNMPATPDFNTWDAEHAALPSPHTARSSQHSDWSLSGVQVSLVVQYLELASNLSAWVSGLHAVSSQVFL